jgi:colicin import membrane protein
MLRQQPFKQKHFFYSLVLHLILLSVFVLGFDFTSPMPVVENTNKDDVINAMVMESSPVTPRKRIPLPAPSVTKAKPLPEPPKPAVVKPQPVEAPKPPVVKPEPVQQAIAIPDKKPKKQSEDLIQKQLLADLKKQTDTKKKVQQQKAMEADFAKEVKELKAKSLEQQMAQEMAQQKQRLEGVQTAQMRGVVDKYRALILQSIGQHWLVPHSANKSLSAQLLIRVAPGGMVLDVQVIKGSGDDALDRSAQAAVFKASPLPVPTDTKEFEPFRQFVLKVKPENILTNNNWTS